jgi:hypothetical protein
MRKMTTIQGYSPPLHPPSHHLHLKLAQLLHLDYRGAYEVTSAASIE